MIDELKKFLDVDLLMNFAQKHHGVYVNMAEFLRDSKIILFSAVMEKLSQMENTTFHVFWDTGLCIYTDHLDISECKYMQMETKALYELLNQQMNDMVNDELIDVRSLERIPYMDMIFFDADNSICISVTHEDNWDGKRLCFEAVIS